MHSSGRKSPNNIWIGCIWKCYTQFSWRIFHLGPGGGDGTFFWSPCTQIVERKQNHTYFRSKFSFSMRGQSTVMDVFVYFLIPGMEGIDIFNEISSPPLTGPPSPTSLIDISGLNINEAMVNNRFKFLYHIFLFITHLLNSQLQANLSIHTKKESKNSTNILHRLHVSKLIVNKEK